MDFNFHSQVFWNLFSTGPRGMERCIFEVYASQISSELFQLHPSSTTYQRSSSVFWFQLRLLTPRTILEDNENSHWQWVFQLFLFPSDSRQKTLGDTTDFSSIPCKRFQLLDLLMLQIFFAAGQPLKGTQNCQYRVFPLRRKQLSQTKILLFAGKAKMVRRPGCTYTKLSFLFPNIL